MNQSPLKHREIVEHDQFRDELKAIEQDAKKADEFIDGAKWVLSRGPQSGTRIGKSHVWFLPIAESSIIEALVIYYTFNDDYVYLLSIQKTEYPPKD
jgi:hypothetical protein